MKVAGGDPDSFVILCKICVEDGRQWTLAVIRRKIGQSELAEWDRSVD